MRAVFRNLGVKLCQPPPPPSGLSARPMLLPSAS